MVFLTDNKIYIYNKNIKIFSLKTTITSKDKIIVVNNMLIIPSEIYLLEIWDITKKELLSVIGERKDILISNMKIIE